MIRAILFDYDGVIVDSFESVFKVYKKICKHYNVSCPKNIEEFKVVYGYNYVECLKNLGIEEKDFSEVNSIFRREIVKMEHGIFVGMADVLKKLSMDYEIYLVSASHSKEVISKMEKFNLMSLFKKVYCGGDHNVRKGDMIKSLLNEYGYSLNEIIFVGDRTIDYDASKKAGLADNNIILVDYGWGLDKNNIGTARVAITPNDLLSLISSI